MRIRSASPPTNCLWYRAKDVGLHMHPNVNLVRVRKEGDCFECLFLRTEIQRMCSASSPAACGRAQNTNARRGCTPLTLSILLLSSEIQRIRSASSPTACGRAQNANARRGCTPLTLNLHLSVKLLDMDTPQLAMENENKRELVVHRHQLTACGRAQNTNAKRGCIPLTLDLYLSYSTTRA